MTLPSTCSCGPNPYAALHHCCIPANFAHRTFKLLTCLVRWPFTSIPQDLEALWFFVLSLHYLNKRACKPGEANNTSKVLSDVSNVTRFQNLKKSAGWAYPRCSATTIAKNATVICKKSERGLVFQTKRGSSLWKASCPEELFPMLVTVWGNEPTLKLCPFTSFVLLFQNPILTHLNRKIYIYIFF